MIEPTYRIERFTQDNEKVVADQTIETLIDISVPEKATMKLISIGTYSNQLDPMMWIPTENPVPPPTVYAIGWKVYVDDRPLDPIFPLGFIGSHIGGGYGRIRQKVENVEIKGGHRFRVFGCNNLFPPEGDGIVILGVSVEYIFIYEEWELETKGEKTGAGKWLRKLEEYLR